MRRTACGACGSKHVAVVLDLGRSPLANNLPTAADATPVTYPLQMMQCETCGLAQIGELVDDCELWNDGYAYRSSSSEPLRAHFLRYFNHVMTITDSVGTESNADRPQVLVVDVGCNDGLLLDHWRRAGFQAIGVDSAGGPIGDARAIGLDVIHDDFGSDLAERMVNVRGCAALVTANNVAAHVDDIGDFLRGLAILLDADGLLVMEVQYLPDLLVGNAFDMVYHEHRFFWTLNPMQRALARVGLTLVHVERVSTQGGSVRLYIQHDVASSSMLARSNELFDDVTSMLLAERVAMGPEPGVLTGLQLRADLVAERLRGELGTLKAAGQTIAGYGAPAKATTLLHWTQTASYLSWVEDTTPSKVGRFIPGTDLEIRKPATHLARQADAYLLLAWNYAREILHRERAYLDDGGRFVVPLPVPTTWGAML